MYETNLTRSSMAFNIEKVSNSLYRVQIDGSHMYRDSFFLFCFLKEKDKDTGRTTAIYYETRRIKIGMYCTPESIGNPDCQIYFEVTN